MLKKVTLASALCALAIPFAAIAAGPTGFNNAERPGAPQGFSHQKMETIAQIKKEAKDDQIIVIQGRFTKQLEKDKYQFTDIKGDTIVVELDDDMNWSHVKKDALMELTAEVDSDFMKTELDGIEAKLIQ